MWISGWKQQKKCCQITAQEKIEWLGLLSKQR